MSTTARKILCPIEFDESFMEAVSMAKNLVKESNGTLYLMHVVAPINDPLMIAGALRPAHDLKVAQAELDRIGREQLADVSHQTVLRVGDPGEEILKAERELGIDLLVLPTHQHSQFFRLLSDGVSHTVIDESQCPVMTLPEKVWSRNAASSLREGQSSKPRKGDVPMAVDKLFHKILCPVDFNHSLQALEFAIRLTQQNDATLCVLSVAPIPIGATEIAIPAGEKYPWWELTNRQRLDELARERLERRVRYETGLLSGEASVRIVQKAAEWGADLIVMATHGRSGLSHFFVGSVTEVVVRQAPCPVLTIRPK